MKTAQWSLILSSDSRVSTQTHTVCARTRLREYNFIYFLLRTRALPLERFGNYCLLCVEQCGFMSIALNCIGRVYVYLCIAPRLGASVTVWGINLLTSASSSLFHYHCSLISTRKRRRGEMMVENASEFHAVAFSHAHGAGGLTKAGSKLRLHCELVHLVSIQYLIHINRTIFYLGTSQNHIRSLSTMSF